MSKYVPDISSKRWVIISSQRSGRPEDTGKKKTHAKSGCPFCPGNEALTPPSVLSFPSTGEAAAGNDKEEKEWAVRVIPNKFPITDLHEVIIHSPEHDMGLVSMPLSQLELVLKAYRERYNFYRKQGQVIIFCNHGDASGASLQHYHSQLVVIPNQINMDALTREPLANVVDENKFFNVWCPDFSQWPYEVWIAPKTEKTYFGDIDDKEINDLATVMQKTLRQLKKIYEKNPLSDRGFNFNYYIYPKESWYMRIIPRFIHRAGFELGTGLSVNIVDPRDAAVEYRDSNKAGDKPISKEERMKNVMGKLLSL